MTACSACRAKSAGITFYEDLDSAAGRTREKRGRRKRSRKPLSGPHQPLGRRAPAGTPHRQDAQDHPP